MIPPRLYGKAPAPGQIHKYTLSPQVTTCPNPRYHTMPRNCFRSILRILPHQADPDPAPDLSDEEDMLESARSVDISKFLPKEAGKTIPQKDKTVTGQIKQKSRDIAQRLGRRHASVLCGECRA